MGYVVKRLIVRLVKIAPPLGFGKPILTCPETFPRRSPGRTQKSGKSRAETQHPSNRFIRYLIIIENLPHTASSAFRGRTPGPADTKIRN